MELIKKMKRLGKKELRREDARRPRLRNHLYPPQRHSNNNLYKIPTSLSSTYQLQVQVPVQRATSAPPPPTLTDRRAAPPTQAWQVTRRHAALSSAEAREGRRPSGAPRCQSAETRGGRFEHRHMAQQRTITEQKRLLKEQQDIISELQEKQNLLELKQEAGKAEQLAVQLKPSASQNVIKTRYLPQHLSHTRNPKATVFIKIELGLLCVTNKFIVEKDGIVIL